VDGAVVEQSVIVEQPSLNLTRRRITLNRAALGKAVVIAASALMLLYLTIPLLVVLMRAIDADLLDQLAQPTVVQALQLSLVTTALSAWQ
jgi:ABC-type sulfate transport system permease component